MLKEQLKINEWLELIKEDKNLNGAYICISQYLYLDEKEKQEIKKQLEEITDYYCEASHIKWERAKRIIELKTQQKEFIKYLKDENKKFDIKANGMGASSERDELIIKARAYREVLQKYKEIVGVSDENNIS